MNGKEIKYIDQDIKTDFFKIFTKDFFMIDKNAEFPTLTPFQAKWIFKKTIPRLYMNQLTGITGVTERTVQNWFADSRQYVPIKAVMAMKLLVDEDCTMQFSAIVGLYNLRKAEGNL